MKRVKDNTALLANEKGFGISFTVSGCLPIVGLAKCYIKKDNGFFIYDRPYIAELQEWLREKHGISVLVFLDCTLSYNWEIKCLHPKASYQGDTLYSLNVWCGDYEACLEDGLVNALKLL